MMFLGLPEKYTRDLLSINLFQPQEYLSIQIAFK